MPYNVRSTSGRSRGQFINKKAKARAEKLSENNRAGRTGKRKLDEATAFEDLPPVPSDCKRYDGRRFIEMDEIGAQLWCRVCRIPLSLQHLLEEKTQGVASRLSIRCFQCMTIFRVDTSKKSNGPYYDSNLKLAISIVDAGMGETNANTFLSGMNVPAVPITSLKRYERIVGPKIEDVAQQSCRDAIETEKALTRQNKKDERTNKTDCNNNEDGETDDLGASIDAAWTKRGRQMNSKSGHASLIGTESGQILAYACREVSCRKCDAGNDKNNHTCRQNHTGSARAMEAAMAVEMVLENENLVRAKCRIKVIIGDDDASSLASLRRLSPYTIVKLSDFNHVKKTFNTKLYEMKLTASLIKYFARVFAMNIKKNQGDALKVKVALDSMIPHAFGDHSKCDSSCVRDEQGVHVYRYFKDGKCLTDMNLKTKLERIIQPYVDSSAQIAPCASSQRNESFNNSACSKHPKNKYFGGSESHCYRVAAAVCQKNIGYTYVMNVNILLQLSPGKHTERFRKRKQEISEYHIERGKTTEFKKRRVILRNQRSSKNVATVNKEGTSYQSGSGYLNTSDLIDEVSIADHTDYEKSEIVVYDIETTGLYQTDEIVQIAAVCQDKKFNEYILPYKDFSSEAAEVTKMKKMNGKLFVGDEEVTTVSAREAFVKFLYFLKSLGKPCILVAHNGFRFDAPRVIRLAKALNLMDQFKVFVKGFSDSVYFFKERLPERLKEKLSFQQTHLVQEYLNGEGIDDAHNALGDVKMLQNLITTLKIDRHTILIHTRSFDFMNDQKSADPDAINCTESLHDIKVSRDIKLRLSREGLSRTKLQAACKKGKESFYMLMSQSVCGKPRITKAKKTIDTLFDALKT